MMLLRLLFFLCFIPTIAYADDGRYRTSFTSPNSQYEFRIIDTQRQTLQDSVEGEYELILSTTWGLFHKAASTPLYSLKGFFGSKTVYVSNNGLALAVVDDYSEAQPADSLEVLSFYCQGTKTSGYRLDQLLCSSYNISQSVSHFDWFSNIRTTPHELIIKTFELATLTFNTDSGKLTGKSFSPLLTKTALLVAGEVKRIGPNQYEIVVAQRVYGQVPANGRVQFTSKRNLVSFTTALIDNGQYQNVEHISDWYLNQGSYKIEQRGEESTKNNPFTKGRKLHNCP